MRSLRLWLGIDTSCGNYGCLRLPQNLFLVLLTGRIWSCSKCFPTINYYAKIVSYKVIVGQHIICPILVLKIQIHNDVPIVWPIQCISWHNIRTMCCDEAFFLVKYGHTNSESNYILCGSNGQIIENGLVDIIDLVNVPAPTNGAKIAIAQGVTKAFCSCLLANYRVKQQLILAWIPTEYAAWKTEKLPVFKPKQRAEVGEKLLKVMCVEANINISFLCSCRGIEIACAIQEWINVPVKLI
ncbi:hypothetical protein FGO68_gene12302 [Halteria grandinella]|uniref:Uncharacterized protein n=1 Tax=Halteria grandinella TaxID=5974 RepID=A0A8J8NIB2_HALGN|nr:hypothetical protein FGO68_gene12302 [Halteria grandinella]